MYFDLKFDLNGKNCWVGLQLDRRKPDTYRDIHKIEFNADDGYMHHSWGFAIKGIGSLGVTWWQEHYDKDRTGGGSTCDTRVTIEEIRGWGLKSKQNLVNAIKRTKAKRIVSDRYMEEIEQLLKEEGMV